MGAPVVDHRTRHNETSRNGCPFVIPADFRVIGDPLQFAVRSVDTRLEPRELIVVPTTTTLAEVRGAATHFTIDLRADLAELVVQHLDVWRGKLSENLPGQHQRDHVEERERMTFATHFSIARLSTSGISVTVVVCTTVCG